MKLSFHTHKSIDIVFSWLTDMQKFAALHPVISKIDQLTGNNYLVHETLKMGIIPISFTYTVTIDHDVTQKTILMRATVMRFTKIEMRYTLSNNSDQTLISEIITIESPLPITSLLENVFRKQHHLLFKNMENAN